MLTKDHLKYRLRKGVVNPAFLDGGDEALTSYLEALLSLAAHGTGQRLFELEAAWEDEGLTEHGLYAAFRKLISDCMQFGEDDQGQIEAQRWQWLRAAQALRQEQLFVRKESFHEALAFETDRPFNDIAESLYEDLPEYRRITAFTPSSAADLIGRYNCAQVQGLLLRARSLTLSLNKASLKDKRDLFRAIKFHRLVAEVEAAEGLAGNAKAKKEETPLCLTLSGPLAVFEQVQTYGTRLANFFPRILSLTDWQLTADINLPERGGKCRLELAPGPEFGPRRRAAGSYIPEEFSKLIDGLQHQVGSDWQVEAGQDFVHLGRQSYCFPDLQLKNKKGEKFYLELFHKWHLGQLKDRLETLRKNPSQQLMLGVCRSVAKKDQIKAILEQSPWFAEHGLVFTDFPTPRAILTVLSRYGPL